MNKLATSSETHSRWGMVFGVSAVLLWGFGPALISLGANALPTWRFVSISTLLGGMTQLIFHRISHGDLRSAFRLPLRLWLIVLFGFAFYGLIFPWALVLAVTKDQLCGVTLINYLWPVLTVTMGVLWVPATRFSLRLFGAILLALFGLGVANYKSILMLWNPAHQPFAASVPKTSIWPFLLALIAAIVWSLYSSLLSRWKEWAQGYTTGAVGFLIIGLIAGILTLSTEGIAVRHDPCGMWMAITYGVGTLGMGYLLWELAISRARIQTLGMLAAVTPILSLLMMCLFMWFVPGVEIVLAAALIATAVVLSL